MLPDALQHCHPLTACYCLTCLTAGRSRIHQLRKTWLMWSQWQMVGSDLHPLNTS